MQPHVAIEGLVVLEGAATLGAFHRLNGAGGEGDEQQ